MPTTKEESKNRIKSIAVIPARGGSKGVPRKNLRPLNGKPLIYYTISKCLDSGCFSSVVVSTDDDEIALMSERFGATVIQRPSDLGGDLVTLDPVILHAVETVETSSGQTYDVVVTVQPTAPLLNKEDLQRALTAFEQDTSVDSVISVVDDRHLCWTVGDRGPRPLYEKRVNRQQLRANFRETGAVIACRRRMLDSGSRIGGKVNLLEVPRERSIDIDGDLDFFICESILRRRRVVFSVVGRATLGMGHAYRALMIAGELVGHDIVFVCEEQDQLAAELIRERNYPVVVARNGELLSAIRSLMPDVVINDILDTSAKFVAELKEAGAKVVNFEDIGEGASVADLVVNALYPHQPHAQNHLIGARYFCLRDEFIHLPKKPFSEKPKRLLVTFGGVDENNLSGRVLTALADSIRGHGLGVDVVVGPGFEHDQGLREILSRLAIADIRYIAKTNRISSYMSAADIAITSGGRTVLELASVGVPTIVICQNERETTHTFASTENGVKNLGLHANLSNVDLVSAFENICADADIRANMISKMENVDLIRGKQLVISEIRDLINQASK
ncbi:NTP transferase domain-containing protein [Cupriavidus necator]|uniref:cytidylyltransferase domain-containing protein n=1 Tax=Cupriavidus necator TaxID=106590 RepID=UPI003ECEC1E6